MPKRHAKSKWCSFQGALCKNPRHWKWTEPYPSRRWFLRTRDRTIPVLHLHGPSDDSEAMVVLCEEAMTHDVAAIKTLGVLAFNNPDYAQYQPLVLALRKSLRSKDKQ